ncbi:MAG: hypothetical protein LKG11_05430 [Bacilli bacterium]|jgi:rRNA-processing protein FCF1|nr:hypothetical protein [Bacilli bacterium]
MYKEETKSSNLAKQLSAYDFAFVDTCSLMEDSFPVFMDTLVTSKEYWREGFSVIVIAECVEELKKHAKSKDKEAQEARIEAKRALKILRHEKWHNRTLEIRKAPYSGNSTGFADEALYAEISSLRVQNKILVITQDKKLAYDLRSLNTLGSIHGRYLKVCRINKDGDLEENLGEPSESNRSCHHRENVRPSVSNDHTKISNHNDRHSDSFKIGQSAKDGNDHHCHEDRHERYSHEDRHDSCDRPLESQNPISQADFRLCSALPNPKYPKEKKIADINAQLTALAVLKPEELNKLSLAYTIDQLKAELTKLGGKFEPAKPISGRPISAPKTVSPAKVEDLKPESSMPRPLISSPVKEAGKPHSWFEFGRTPADAIKACGTHEGLMFRDPSIPFFKGVHGPVDLTTDDLTRMSKSVGTLSTGESKELPIGGLIVHVEKTERDYKAYMIKPSQPAKVVAAPKVESTKSVAVAKGAGEEAPKAVISKPKAKLSVRRGRPKKPAEEGPTVSETNIAAPFGATLIVGVPNDDTKAYIERKSRREDGQTLGIVRRDGSKGVDRVEPAKTSAHVGRKPKTGSPVNKRMPVAKKPVKPKAEPKVPRKTPVKTAKAKPTSLSEALTADKALSANINNPNYPIDNKVKDLKAQKARIRGLSEAERKKLLVSLAKISAKLVELGKK